MSIFLDRLDSAPIAGNDFNFEFNQWISVLINVLNEVIEDLQNALNVLTAPNLALLTESVTLTTGLPTFTVANGTLYSVGENVVGSGIPAGTTIKTILVNLITLTANATSTGASTLTFIPAQGATVGNGILIYDTTTNLYVGMQNGSLVKFTTAAYP